MFKNQEIFASKQTHFGFSKLMSKMPNYKATAIFLMKHPVASSLFPGAQYHVKTKQFSSKEAVEGEYFCLK